MKTLLFVSAIVFLTQIFPAYGAQSQGIDLSAFLNICQHSVEDYPKLREEVDRQYPVGTSADALLNLLKKKWTLRVDAEPVVDVKELGTNQNSDAINLAEQKPNSSHYVFVQRCTEDHGNLTKWTFAILMNGSHSINLIEFRPLLDEDQDFQARGIPFNFDYFSSDRARQKSLSALIPPGMSKRAALAALDGLEEGFLGHVVEKTTLRSGQKVIYRYRTTPEASVGSRILGGWEFLSVIVLNFDKDEKLVSLKVN